MSAHVLASIQVIDLSLISAADTIKSLSKDSKISPEAITQSLQNAGRGADASYWIIFIDAQGRGVAASNNVPVNSIYFADRPYFAAQVQNTNPGLFVGGPVMGKATNRRVFSLSRRVTSSTGQFIGVVVASVDPGAFAKVFANALFDPSLNITLSHRDGKVVARVPRFEESFATNIAKSPLFQNLAVAPSGSYEAKSVIDGENRIYSYNTIENLPLVVSVGMSNKTLATGLANDFFPAAVGVTVIIVVLLFSGNYALRSFLSVVESEDNLAQSERQLNEAQEVSQVGSYSVDLDTGARTFSAVTAKIFGFISPSLTSTADQYRKAIHPDDWERTREEFTSPSDAGERLSTQFRITRQNDGLVRWVSATASTIFDEKGKAVRRTGTIKDITEQREMEDLLSINQQAVEQSSTAIFIVDARANSYPMIYVNEAAEVISGYSRKELEGQNCRMLRGHFDNQHSVTEIRNGLSEKRKVEVIIQNMRPDGTAYWIDLRIIPLKNSRSEVTHFVGFQYDLTDRIRYENELIHQAGHDALTGLVNRNLLKDRLDQIIFHAKKDGSKAALIFLDLDKFKLVNDSLGHFAGDQLLKQCAKILTDQAPVGATVARMGGDEFVVLLEKIDDHHEAKKITERILKALTQPIDLNGNQVVMDSSAGIAMFPMHGATATDLLRNADIAMYRAKSNGRAQCLVFENVWSDVETRKLTLKNEIETGIKQRQFCLHYQPKVDARSGVLIGFEALVRWNHPAFGLLYPDRFIDAAEEFGLILPLGNWILKEACRQNRVWRDTKKYDVPIAVNVSASQFKDDDFMKSVLQSLQDYQLDPAALELEVTESVVMESPERFIGVLSELHSLGIPIAVDDFGTGYSSLSFIKRFPIDVLKIDKSFVRDIGSDPSDAAICQTIIDMAHNLGLSVVAEGVETSEQASFLLNCGCDVFQGYLFSKPLPPETDFVANIKIDGFLSTV